jgi:hypothetical protein
MPTDLTARDALFEDILRGIVRVGNRPSSTEGEIRTSLFKPERRASSQPRQI